MQERLRERARESGLQPQDVKGLSDQPVLAYSVAYPIGVIGALICFQLAGRLWPVALDPPLEAPELAVRDFVVKNPAVIGHTIREVMSLDREAPFVISRVQQGGRTAIARSDTTLSEGDIVAVVGDDQALRRAKDILGAISPSQIELDRSDLDYRRVFVSSPEIVGKRIGDLDLPDRLSAVITRLRRGDLDIVPDQATRLEYGDRVRVVTRRANFAAVARFFGDSVRGASEMQVGSQAMGLVLGVIVGMLPIPLGGGSTMRLGLAGGSLFVGLLLGRTRAHRQDQLGDASAGQPDAAPGWAPPVLAGLGTQAGYSFLDTLRDNGGQLLLAGGVVTFAVTLATLIVGRQLLGIRSDALLGLAAGVQTQPACLAYANELARSEVPSAAYAAVFPTAMIVKIVVAQLLLT